MRYVQIRLHGETMSDETKQHLMLAVQQALISVTGHDDVPACITIDEVPASNWRLMSPTDEGEAEGSRGAQSNRKQPPLAPVGQFDYRGGPDFGSTGIIAHLAGLPGERYTNPAEAGLITVTASSLAPDSSPPSAVLGNEVVRFVTRAAPNSWVQFDFGQYRVAPTHYALRHYASWDTEALRSWTLEGSEDGTTWCLLSMVQNDASLNQRGATHTWATNQLFAGVHFRYLRLTQRGPNSNRHHFLALSGFEVHGALARVAVTAPDVNTVALERLKGRLKQAAAGGQQIRRR